MRWFDSIAFLAGAMLTSGTAVTERDVLVIDDRSTGTLTSSIGTTWRGISDQVMGGLSSEQVALDTVGGKDCVRLTGEVRLDNNGGFIQLSLDLARNALMDASGFAGLRLLVYGNGQTYNAHVRTADLDRPWQSYRHRFRALPEWTWVHLPFSDFEPYRTRIPLAVSRLKRIGLVAIGRPFHADLCVANVAFYR